MENYISILGICVTVVVVAITSYFNQKESRQHQLFVEKLRIYTTYLQNVSESSVKNISEQKESDLLLRHIQAKQEMILFAPFRCWQLRGRRSYRNPNNFHPAYTVPAAATVRIVPAGVLAWMSSNSSSCFT